MTRSNKEIIYSISMKTNRNELMRRLLSGITNDDLENLVRVREEARSPIPAPRKRIPIPTPRKRIPTPAPRKMGVKQLIRYFENDNLYKPTRPIPAPRTEITGKSKALKGYTKSYETAIKNDEDVLKQLQNTRLATSRFF